MWEIEGTDQFAAKNTKELRPPSSSIRILFVFDPRRAAILLLGGDKQGQWDTWYDKNVPIATPCTRSIWRH